VALVFFASILAIGLCPLIGEATVQVILHFWPSYQFDPHPTIKALHDGLQPRWVVVGLWIGAVAVAPIAEEFFFRGLLQTFLAGIVRNRWLAIGLTAIVFGIVHLSQPHTIVALAALGVLLGYAYERTGSLVPSIMIHAVFNLKTLIWDAFAGVTP
jgi:membrane protease YdiL (CAAX protease family)